MSILYTYSCSTLLGFIEIDKYVIHIRVQYKVEPDAMLGCYSNSVSLVLQ